MKSESGCSDPKRHQEQALQKREVTMLLLQSGLTHLLREK
jgi:hypothetical protein